MRFRLLATDFDGTLARRGEVGTKGANALGRWRRAGGLLAMVTGRELDEIRQIYPGLVDFDIVVAENGAMLYWPATGREMPLGEPPPPEFLAALRARGVAPMSAGRIIVAAWLPDEELVVDVIREMGLKREITCNKGSIMVLPVGVNKLSGLRAALGELGVAAADTVGFGDAENDIPFLEVCGFSVAVGNALDLVKAVADHVTRSTHGEGLAEAVDLLLDQPDTAAVEAAGGPADDDVDSGGSAVGF